MNGKHVFFTIIFLCIKCFSYYGPFLDEVMWLIPRILMHWLVTAQSMLQLPSKTCKHFHNHQCLASDADSFMIDIIIDETQTSLKKRLR